MDDYLCEMCKTCYLWNLFEYPGCQSESKECIAPDGYCLDWESNEY